MTNQTDGMYVSFRIEALKKFGFIHFCHLFELKIGFVVASFKTSH